MLVYDASKQQTADDPNACPEGTGAFAFKLVGSSTMRKFTK